MKNKNIYVLAIVLLVVFSGYLLYKNDEKSKKLSIVQKSFSARDFLKDSSDQKNLQAKLENKYTNSTKNLLAQSSAIDNWCDELWGWYLENQQLRKLINSGETELAEGWTMSSANNLIDGVNGGIFNIMGNYGCAI